MRDSGSSGDKVFGRFHRADPSGLGLAREEAERCGHRYLGPEHVLLGLLAKGHSAAAGVLGAHGVDLTAARAGLLRLGERGMVPSPRPSDAELLESVGIDLDAVRHNSEQAFGAWAVGRRPGGDPPAWMVGPAGGVDAAVRPVAGRQAGPAAGQRAGACPGPRPGQS
jgi:hypothetical protein